MACARMMLWCIVGGIGAFAYGNREECAAETAGACNADSQGATSTAVTSLHSDHALIQIRPLTQKRSTVTPQVLTSSPIKACDSSHMERRRRNSNMCSCRRRSGSSAGNPGFACIEGNMQWRCSLDGEDPFGIAGAEGDEVKCCEGLERCQLDGRFVCKTQCPDRKHELLVDWVKFFPMDGESVAESPTWEDHFENCPNNRPDPSKWKYEIFGPNSKNSEAQTYTDSSENSFCEGGKLVLRALCKDDNNCMNVTCSPDGGCRSPHGAITSGSVETNGFLFGFGRLSARLKIYGEQEGLVGKGMWPAFWSLGEDIYTNGWPSCGEIDIMEYSEPHKTNGQNAYFRNNPYTWERQHWVTTETKVANYPTDSDGYRVFTLEYAQDAQGHTRLRMWVTETYEETLEASNPPNIEYPKPDMPPDMIEDFDHSFNGKKINAKLNVAIGGNLGGKGPYF